MVGSLVIGNAEFGVGIQAVITIVRIALLKAAAIRRNSGFSQFCFQCFLLFGMSIKISV